MLRLILAILLFLPPQVWGGVFVGFGQSSCAGDTTLVSYTTSTTEYGNIQVFGQSFTLATSKTVYAIKLSGSGSSGVVEFRLGTSNNLGTYTARVASVNMADSGTTTITLDTPVVLSSGTYYFAVSRISGTTNLLIDTAGAYSGGSQYYENTPGVWNMLEYGSRDIWFEVVGCN